MCNKKSPLSEILFRFDAYFKLSLQALRAGIPLTELLRARYPFYLPEPKKPSMVSLELTNICNCSCIYCPISMDIRKKGTMSSEIFDKLLQYLREFKINRVHVRGWGEPTLHPKFPEYMKQLSNVVKLVDIVTNGQWKHPDIIHSLLSAPVHRIDISVDLGGKAIYEEVRHGASFDRLIENLSELRRLRDRLRSKSKIIIRSMFRPSQANLIEKEKKFYLKYADMILPSPIFRKSLNDEEVIHNSDIYTLTAAYDKFPRCYFPFNELFISWDGNVPLCDNLVLNQRVSEVIIGNLLVSSLKDIWEGNQLRRLRNAHKYEIDKYRPYCKGCPTC